MARTKFFRVAVEGPTVDGRTIERAHIQQMAASYNPATYTARINCEHLRGYSPNPPFNAYGSIAATKTEEVDVEIGGKTEKKLALFASFEVNDQAKELTKSDQKIFPSIEIAPNFANSGKAYLAGLALTDSPASLATEVLKFSTRDDKRKDNLIAVDEAFSVEFEEDAGASSEVTGAFAAMKQFFTGLTAQKQEPELKEPANPSADKTGGADLTAFATAMGAGLDKLASAIEATNTANATRFAALEQKIGAVQADIEKTPNRNYTSRPAATGGGDRIQADC